MALVTTIKAVIEADSSKLARGLDKAGGQLRDFGQKTARAGTKVTAGVTLPLVGIGTAAFKTAADFEASMTQIQSLVGLSAETVQGFEKDVLNLAGETGRAPKELADAMFFITSAGLRGADAVEALEASAKAAAAGLGDTEVVADAVTNALNGYEAGSISAAQATDILVKTVEQGKASAADLAPQFGRLVPMAAELGVSMDQLGGGLAFLTRSSGDASQASVGLKGILSKLVKPSQQGIKELEKMGLSMEDLRKHVREKGLLSALNMLKKGSEENGFEMAKFFEDVEGLNGVLALTGPKAAEAREVFDELSKSTGKLDEAFAIASETTEFKMNQAMAGMKTLLVDIGSTVLPVVVPLIQKLTARVREASEWFKGLNESQKRTIMIVAGVAAGLGPLLVVVGKVVGILGTLLTVGGKVFLAFTKLKVLLLATVGPVGLVVAAVAALAAGLVIAYQRSERFRRIVDGVGRWLAGTFGPTVRSVAKVVRAVWDEVARFAKKFLEPVVRAAFEGIIKAGQKAADFFRTLVRFFSNLVTGNWSELWDNFKDVAEAAVGLVVALFIELPMKVGEALRPLMKVTARAMLDGGLAALDAISKFTANSLVPFFARMPRRIFAAVVAAGGFLAMVGEHLGSELLEGLKDFLDDVGKVAAAIKDGAIGLGRAVVDWVVDGIKGIGGAIADAILDALPSPGDILGGIGGVLGKIPGLGGIFGGKEKQSAGGEKKRATTGPLSSTDALKLLKTGGDLSRFLVPAPGTVKGKMTHFTTDPSQRGLPGTTFVDTSSAASLDRFFESQGIKVPKMANGGVVSRPTMAMIGEAGPEAVVPLGKKAGMTVVVNVGGSVVTERDLVESIRQGLLQSQRSGRQLVI